MNRLLIKKQAKASLKGKWGKSIGLCLVVGILTGLIPGIFYGIATAFSTTKQTAEGIQITSTTGVGAFFIILAIIALIVVAPIFEYAKVKAFLKNNRGEDFTVGNAFDGFKEAPVKNVCTGIVRYLAIWLCYFVPAFLGGIFAGIAGAKADSLFNIGTMLSRDEAMNFVKSVGPLLCIAYAFIVAAIVIGIIATFMYQMVFYVRVDNPDMGIIQVLKTSRKIMHGRKIDLFVLCFTFIGWTLVSAITCGIGLLWLIPYVEASTAAFYDAAKDEII